MFNRRASTRFRNSRPASDGWAGRLQSEQTTALGARSGLLAFGSIAGCLGILATFWPDGKHQYLLGLSTFLIVAHSLAILCSPRHDPGRPQVASRTSVLLRVGITAIVALAWATAPLTLMPHATSDQGQLLAYIFSGLAWSSILLAPILPSALLFAGIVSLGLLLPMAVLDQTMSGRHAMLIVFNFCMICGVVLHQHRDFMRRVTNELTLADQGEIIGLLLRDFEENASDWLWDTDADLRLHRVSGRLTRILGCDQAALQGVRVQDLVVRADLAAGADARDRSKLFTCLDDMLAFRDLQVPVMFRGRTYWFSLTGKPIFDDAGNFLGYRGVGSDVTAAHLSSERAAHFAHYDSLTDLPNRTLFQTTLNHACADALPFALLCLDLDGFKSVNDTLGHSMGDALLVAVAGRLRLSLRDGDMVARLGSDEFAVLQIGGDVTTSEALAARLIRRIAEPYQLGTVSTSIGLSVGIALSGGACAVPDDLLQGADLALHESRMRGRGNWHFFETGMAQRAQERRALQADLRHAIDRGEMTLDFQPILDIVSGDVTGAEALVRWLHPARGRISPADFIPIAEESGLIVALGSWVLRRACQEAVTWVGEARVAVNLSPLQFRDPGLLALIDRVLGETGLPPQRLELEITESVFLDAADRTVACLQSLRARGIHIALDDFGTGYSSLSYLRSFPFDKVKIDQSFIRDLSVNQDAIAIVQAIVGMASSLGMHTTGEGVETVLQAQLLQLTGCSQVQGYLFGRPCPAAAIASIMMGNRPPIAELLGLPPAASTTSVAPSPAGPQPWPAGRAQVLQAIEG